MLFFYRILSFSIINTAFKNPSLCRTKIAFFPTKNVFGKTKNRQIVFASKKQEKKNMHYASASGSCRELLCIMHALPATGSPCQELLCKL
jgi:hypothetical protein